jgi:hypothetical protein
MNDIACAPMKLLQERSRVLLDARLTYVHKLRPTGRDRTGPPQPARL